MNLREFSTVNDLENKELNMTFDIKQFARLCWMLCQMNVHLNLIYTYSLNEFDNKFQNSWLFKNKLYLRSVRIFFTYFFEKTTV